MAGNRKNLKVSEEVYRNLTEEKQDRETWDRLFIRLLNEETLPPGSYEEATLQFKEYLDSEGGTTVDLLVELTTGSDGWRIEKKHVTDTGYHLNDRDGRARIAEALADGARVPLYVGKHADEEFKVNPVLTWRADDLGNPIVADVELQVDGRVE